MSKPLIVSLLAFRNEEIFLPTYLSSMKQVADVMLGYDDGSSDNSSSIFRSNGGTLIEIPLLLGSHGRGATKEVREYLLTKGREFGGTHFIVLDADEFFGGFDPKGVRDLILKLEPSQKMRCYWVIASGNGSTYLNENSVWKPGLKDFAFADDPRMSYPNNSFVHFSRTPVCENGTPPLDVPFNQYSVLHLQFLNWKLGQIKQCWYRIQESVVLGKNYSRVNNSYQFTKEAPIEKVQTRFPKSFEKNLNNFDFDSIIYFPIIDSWYFRDISRILRKTKRRRIINLDIWFLEEMRNLYFEIYGRHHKHSRFVEHVNRMMLRAIHVRFLISTLFRRNSPTNE